MYPGVLAKTLALTRSLADAEDAVQDAFERALRSWPDAGRPDSPEAWLVTVAANRHRDRLRRVRREERDEDVVADLAALSPWAGLSLAGAEARGGWNDELLRVLFACCHPALEPGESAALALATVIGMSVEEIARAFLVPPRTMEQRLTRARRRLRDRGDPDGAEPSRAKGRIGAVLTVVHLLFNEGYWSGDDEQPIRHDLCRLAVGLAGSLARVFPDEGEVAGLLALILLHDARRGARFSSEGEPVALPEQDRGRWDRAAIGAAEELLERTLARGAPGAYQIEAAISAVHCRARTPEDTDWREIAALYALLERWRPTAAVRVNRAFAVSRTDGALAGLALLDSPGPDTSSYPYVHLVRGVLLGEVGRVVEARASLASALLQARNAAEAKQIKSRIDRLPP